MKFTVDEARPVADDVAAQIVAQLTADSSPLQVGDVKSFGAQIASEAVKMAKADPPSGDEPDGDEEEMDGEAKSEKMLDAIWDAAHQLMAQRTAKQELAKNRVKSVTADAIEAGKSYAAEYQRPGKSRTRGFSDDGDGSVKRFSFNKLDDDEYGPSLINAVKALLPSLDPYERTKYSRASFKGTSKALNPYAGATGGYLLNNTLSPTILDPLRPQVIAFKLGVTQEDLDGTGSSTTAKMTNAPTAFRPGINTAITDSTPTYQAITLFPKPIAAMTIIPRQQLLAGLPSTEEQIRNQLIKSIRLQIDKEIFIGTGNVVSPDTGAGIRGILQVAAAANQVTLATDGRQLQFSDLIAAQTQLDNQNVEEDETMGYALHPTMRGTLRSMTDTTGQPLFRQNYSAAAFADVVGAPLQVSTQIPKNITTGANTDTSYMFYGRWSSARYGMLNEIAILVDEITLMNDLQVRIIAYTFSDFVVDYPEAFYVASGVRA